MGSSGKKNQVWLHLFGTAAEGTCCKCGKPLRFKQATLEHIVPTGLGGPDIHTNWGISHPHCNHAHSKVVRQITSLLEVETPAEEELHTVKNLAQSIGLSPLQIERALQYRAQYRVHKAQSTAA